MNCDQAFDAMTDPRRIDTPALSHHLASCVRCQQMYQTLEPALGLFAVPGQEPRGEHERHSANEVMSSVQMAEQVAARLSPSERVKSSFATRSQLLGTVIAASALGFLLSVSLTMLLTEATPSSPAIITQCSWLNRNAVSGNEPASVVAQTCVTCHLSRGTEASHGQASLINVSAELEQLMVRWQQVIGQPVDLNVVIAHSPRKDSHDV